ncbi:bifunctional riboflavin kinase/FAD synthetase [Alphaproteobacteria bacterium]|nr:bifunctional riboflavin kinase/FAD synthetase [Alphaproteobacteria bacterium]
MTRFFDKSAQIIDWATTDAPIDGVELCAAIGNFDGVHKGHQKVVEAAVRAAQEAGMVSAVITFDPHPREYFRQDDAPFHLADRIENDRLLSGLGVDRIIHVQFDDNLRRTDATEFVTTILPSLGVKQLFAGVDFAFGKGRGGDVDTIKQIGAKVGISAHPVALLVDEHSVVISSSRIRAALQAGEPEQAAEMLGHDWAVTGIVQQGDQRGRTIGFPTANIVLGPLQNPAFGVYAVEIYEECNGKAPELLGNGVANIGIRPTVENRGVLCEAHLFDQNIDLYGRRLSIRLKAFLRGEKKFSGIEELTTQIAKDADQARAILPASKQTA